MHSHHISTEERPFSSCLLKSQFNISQKHHKQLTPGKRQLIV